MCIHIYMYITMCVCIYTYKNLHMNTISLYISVSIYLSIHLSIYLRIRLRTSCNEAAPSPDAARRQSSEALAALEAERDRKFEALTKAGADRSQRWGRSFEPSVFCWGFGWRRVRKLKSKLVAQCSANSGIVYDTAVQACRVHQIIRARGAGSKLLPRLAWLRRRSGYSCRPGRGVAELRMVSEAE